MGQEENGKENIKLRSTKSMMEELNQLTAFAQYKMFSENKKFSGGDSIRSQQLAPIVPGPPWSMGSFAMQTQLPGLTLSHITVSQGLCPESGGGLYNLSKYKIFFANQVILLSFHIESRVSTKKSHIS